jgi:excisionase family DNA binding protein
VSVATRTDELLKASQVAELLGVTMPTVLAWWRRGILPGYRLGGGGRGPVRFSQLDVDEKLAEWRREGVGSGSG